MIIELCGLPGSGKTYLYNKLKRKELKRHNIIKADDVLNYFLRNEIVNSNIIIKCLLLIKHKFITLIVFRVFFQKSLLKLTAEEGKIISNFVEVVNQNVVHERSGMWSFHNLYERIVIWVLLKKYCEKKLPGFHIIWDEGVVQGVLHLSVNHDDTVANKYIANVIQPEVCIYYDIPIPVTTKRLVKRKKMLIPHKNKTPKEIEKNLETLRCFLQKSLIGFESNGTYISVVNNDCMFKEALFNSVEYRGFKSNFMSDIF